MKLPFPAALALVAAALAATTTVVPTTSAQSATDPVARGRHPCASPAATTAQHRRFRDANGATPEKDWLAGDAVGWQGAWGDLRAQPADLLPVGRRQGVDRHGAHARVQAADADAVAAGDDGRRPPRDRSVRALARSRRRAGARLRTAGPAGQRAGRQVPGAPEMSAPRRRASDVPRTTGAQPRPRPHSERTAADAAPTPSPSTSRPKRKPRFVL